MRIHKLWAENVRGISSRVNLELSPTGLNLISAPNEMGKTTLAQVLDFIFQYKSSSNAQEIQDLKPYGKDVGPLMGAIIEVNGQTYKIEKQWLKNKKTEVELLAPEKKALAGNDADKVLNEIFTEYLDETIWRMIQVAQAHFIEILQVKYNEDRRSALSNYLAQAVVNAETFEDSNLVEKVESEYQKWWTPKGKLVTASGTPGRSISEKSEEIDALKKTVAELSEKIAEATEVEQDVVVKRESREILRNRKRAQDANRELLAAQHELKIRSEVQEKIDQLLYRNASIKDFSPDLFDAIKEDRVLHAQYNSLSSIQLTSLSELNLSINENSSILKKGELLNLKLKSPLNITIPHLLSIDYRSDESGTAGLEEGAKRFLENLEKLGCESFQAAQELNDQYLDYASLTAKLNALLAVHTHESLQAVIDKNEAIKIGLPNWDIDVAAPLVSTIDLEEVAQQVGQQEGRSEEISRNGWYTTLEETREKIADLEKRLSVLNRKARGSRMLYEVLEQHRSSAEKDYSIHFAGYINALARVFYGEDVEFEVSDSFEILSRRMGSTKVKVADLSTGAKEQLVILIRLALTQIVQVGESFPVIFDDEFAHSDPDRIAMMKKVFSNFAEEQQFILFTCHLEKFSSYKPERTIDLTALHGA